MDALIKIDFIKRNDEPEIRLWANRKKKKIRRRDTILFFLLITFVYFSISIADPEYPELATFLIACFCAALLFISGILLDYVMMGATTDRVTSEQLRIFLHHYQVGRKIKIEAKAEGVKFDIGGESEEIKWEDFSNIVIEKDYIFSKKKIS